MKKPPSNFFGGQGLPEGYPPSHGYFKSSRRGPAPSKSARTRRSSAAQAMGQRPLPTEGPLPLRCESCGLTASACQPDADDPDRLIAVCGWCGSWTLIDRTAGTLHVALLPSPGQAEAPPKRTGGTNRGLGARRPRPRVSDNPSIEFKDSCLDEKESPPVNLDILKSVASGQLRGKVAKKILNLVANFQSWKHAYKSIIFEKN
jgi:hypothetical protein